MLDNFPIAPGSYALLLHSSADKKIKIGKLGEFLIKKGYYVYIGSAFGPGGLKAIIGRHLKKNKKLRWHIDYLRKVTGIVDIKYSTSKEKLECRWAEELAEKGAIIHCKGFGASDCKCNSHLFYFESKPISLFLCVKNNVDICQKSAEN